LITPASSPARFPLFPSLRLALALLTLLSWCGLPAQSFQLNGAAQQTGDVCYQLTPDVPGQSGNIFSTDPIDLTMPFTLSATYFVGCKDGNGADGIVFILAQNNTSLGNGGGGIGYEGISPSIAVEVDDYFNSNYNDPTADHLAIISNGSMDHGGPTNLAGPINLTNVEDCEEHCFFVDWNPASLTLTAVLDDEVITYTGNIVTSIFGGNNLVYYGFSAGTGSLSNLHWVCFGPPELIPMEDVTLCDETSTELQADEQGIRWTWAPDPTLSSTTISNPTATPTTTTTYTVAIDYNCGYTQYDTVTVTVNPLPVAEADNDGPVCEGETLSLFASGGTMYDWSGPGGFQSGSQNPTINDFTIDMEGIYTVTVTDAAGCTSEATTYVEVDLGPEIEFDPLPDPLCLNLDPFLLIASPAGGIWDGDVTPGGLFDPGYVGEGIFTVSYTATNAQGCSNTEYLDIEVLGIPDVIIDPAGPYCDSGSPVQLTATPSGGLWSGPVSINGIFDPATAGAGSHVITYTANDGNGCTNSAEIVIEVVPGLTADIDPPGPFCVTDPPVQLFADPPGGTWGGAADDFGLLDPGALGAGFHIVTYTLANAQGCYYGESTIEIIDAPNAQITGIGPLCDNAGMQTLVATPPGGTWGGAADPLGQVDPAVLGSGTHLVTYSYSAGAGCTDVDSFDLLVLPPAPQGLSVTEICDSTATMYVVVFTITGGDPATYVVTGSVTGTILPGNPAIFTSDPIPNGTSYQFIVDDGNQCAPDTITGDHECLCATNAGSMDLTPITACEGDAITVTPPTGVVLDPDDALVYVLHTGDPMNPIVTSDSTVFGFVPPLQTGVTYFISSMAGNGIPGGVDPNDPCLSVSFGTPVQWLARPGGSISLTTPICQGETATITFDLVGTGPFTVQYGVGANLVTLNGISSGYTIQVSPATTTTYTLAQVGLFNLAGCTSMPNQSVTLEVIAPVTGSQSVTLCAGDSLFVGGAWQTTNGTYTDSLTSAAGCDSLLNTTLVFLPVDTTYLFDTSCDPADTGVFIDTLTTQAGCDSILVTTVTYAESDTTTLTSMTCDAAMAGVFTSLFTGSNGCDSLVIETVSLSPSDTTYVAGETCDPANAGTTMQVLQNQFGCDSLVITDIGLLPSDVTDLDSITCDSGAVGVWMQVLTNVFGCDSLVRTHIILGPRDSCFPQEPPREIFIPNVFSPNGDGLNDVFYISAPPEALSDIPWMRIYDRWGGLVTEMRDLQPNDPSDGWNGTFQGQIVNPGVYVWVVQLRLPDGHEETRAGDVTVLR